MSDKSPGRFKVLQKLGQGGFAKTLLVEDLDRNRELRVIKVPLDKAREKALINELIQAGALMGSLQGLSHPNIVRCYGFDQFQDDDLYYVMIMEFVPGKDLRKVIGPIHRTRRPMDVSKALDIIGQVCNGLAEAHRIHMLHRDIKPDNILIHQDTGMPKLADFGIAKIQIAGGLESGTVIGTYPYMAPEALDGHACPASDLWSLTVTLYELITGCLPFQNENTFSLMNCIKELEPTQPKDLNPAVDDWVNALVMRGLQKDPNKRFQTAEEMLEALSHDLKRVVEKIRKCFMDGQEETAERQARNLLRDLPDEPSLYMLIGEFYHRRQQFHQAELIFSDGLRFCPNHAGLVFLRALSLHQVGRRAEARQGLEEALALGGLMAGQDRQARLLLNSLKS